MGIRAVHGYQRKSWLIFRDEVIELDGGVCTRCRRGALDGAVLQIHHKEYLPGKLPWEYPYDLCETLCKRCHAGEHGIVRPFIDWECIGHEDLGELSGTCEVCGARIRHVFFVQHSKWPSLEVGETCCDHLTDNTEASDHIDSLRRFEGRRKRFTQSPRWKSVGHGECRIQQKGADLVVEPAGDNFRLRVNNISGKRSFPTITETKEFAFELLENGKLESFLTKLNNARPPSQSS